MAAGAPGSAPTQALQEPQIAYRDETGAACSGPLTVLWNMRFEQVLPVRAFGSFRGQRHFSGAWWFATTGEQVGFESWVERDRVMLLDFDPDIVSLSSQPFWLSWQDREGARVRHVPDFFARRRDGSALVVDVRPEQRVRARDEVVFSTTKQVCAAVGWDYQRVGCLDPVLAANLRWLAGYRHPRCLDALCGQRILEAVSGSLTLAQGVDRAGDRLAALPSLFHLVWAGAVTVDLASGPLSLASMVSRAEARAA